MKDQVLNDFISKLLSEDIVDKKFEQHIDMFSRFLAYTNSDYKYNGTYLSQYVEDFMQVYRMLQKKNEIYHQIFSAIKGIGCSFKLEIDQMFIVDFKMESDAEIQYIGMNKDKIVSKDIEIKIEFKMVENAFVFCKGYKEFEDDDLVHTIFSDINNYIETKEDRRAFNEIA